MTKKKSDNDHNGALLLARRSLAAYATLVHPSYQVYKHHSILIRKLEAVAAGSIRRLMIFMPPRMGKSFTSTDIFPAWYMGLHPGRDVITASYSQEFVEGFGRKVRNHVADVKTRSVFPELQLADDSQSAKRFNTTANGSYYAVGRGGSIAGRGGHLILIGAPSVPSVPRQGSFSGSRGATGAPVRHAVPPAARTGGGESSAGAWLVGARRRGPVCLHNCATHQRMQLLLYRGLLLQGTALACAQSHAVRISGEFR